MWPPSDRRTEAVRAAAAGPIDWPRVLRVARRHQVIELVHEGLTRVQPNVPSDIAGEISARASMLVRESLAIARESLRLQRLFDEADLPVLVVKGAALAMVAFSNLGLRSAQDIDLLVAYETLGAPPIPNACSPLLNVGSKRPPKATRSFDYLVRALLEDGAAEWPLSARRAPDRETSNYFRHAGYG
jgi:Uncharacterised nucleotidyltransferase